MSQKLRRELLPVGVVESGVLEAGSGELPTAWGKVIGAGLVLKTREPLRCLGLSFTSFTSGKEVRPDDKHFNEDDQKVRIPKTLHQLHPHNLFFLSFFVIVPVCEYMVCC